MNLDPNQLNKYLYIERTPTWLVRALYGYGAVSWILVIIAFSFSIATDPIYRFLVAPILAVLSLYYLSSYLLNLAYRKFDTGKHKETIRCHWQDRREPPVDIFLPICGEEISILRNTWTHVSRIRYSNVRVYVLDDSNDGCEAHKNLADDFGFTYFARPNKGEMKKAGNLKYAFERSKGDFIAIFDADFAPHPDFLRELVPYMRDPAVAIVQTPQYFETSGTVYNRSKIEYGSSYVQEDFYRVIQVARDRLGGALCCGSNAIYRRKALEEIGGPLQVRYSEDSRTGVALVARGWLVRYLPIILAVGLCPRNPYAYFHQQHRWSSGSMELLSGKQEFWLIRMPLFARLCYLSGFFYYLHHPFAILMSFQLFLVLFFYNDFISLAGASFFYPYLIFSFIFLPLFHIARIRPGVFLTFTLQLYAYTHAVVTVLFLRKSVSWIPTNARHATYSRAFFQVILLVSGYLFVNLSLLALGVRSGFLNVFDYNFYAVQFWILYNLTLSGFLLWSFYKTMDQMQCARVSSLSLAFWRIKTLGGYLALVVGSFAAILVI